MKDILAVAIDLHDKGSVLNNAKGIPVDGKDVKGPVRIKLSELSSIHYLAA